MDVGAFVQENKRWLIGCAIGGIAWLVAGSVIESLFDPADHRVSMRGLGMPEAAYDSAALTSAQEARSKLEAERQRLEQEIAFEVADKYANWSGPADTHLFEVGRNLKRSIVDRGSLSDVLVEEAGIDWARPAGVDEIRKVLIGLDLMDEIQQRLFAAHDQVRGKDEDALGLVALNMLKVESQRGRPSMRRSRRGDGVEIGDLLQQQRVTLAFDADEPTITAFLESLRQPGRTLVVDQWTLTAPPRPGDPCSVKATLAGITFVQKEEE